MAPEYYRAQFTMTSQCLARYFLIASLSPVSLINCAELSELNIVCAIAAQVAAQVASLRQATLYASSVDGRSLSIAARDWFILCSALSVFDWPMKRPLTD